MFRLDVLQNQWLVFAMAGGAAIVLGIVLFSLAMRRPRVEGGASPPRKSGSWLSGVPALLILVYAFVVVFALVYTARMIRQPPNW